MIDLAVQFPALPDAACRDTAEPEAFFSFDDRKTEQARNMCRRCPAIRACLAWALTHDEYGVWAATTETQRADLAARYGRTA